MLSDVGLPIQFPENARDEILIVYFNGFIKNASEGIVRTMLREEEDWIEKYPYLETFIGMTQDELYENTMLMMPRNLLYALSDELLSLDEIDNDLTVIEPNVILDNSKITAFEFSLYQLLHEKNVKRCYFFKETEFYENELKYIERQYNDVLEKIECVNGSFVLLFEDIKPTTSFISDCNLLLNTIIPNYDKEILDEMMFVVLNTAVNIEYSEEDHIFLYNESYINKVKHLNDTNTFGIASMFNFALVTEETEFHQNDDKYEED